MTLIKGKLVSQAGSATRLQYVMLKNKHVRVSVDGELITGESVMIPVEEDGNVEFEAEPGPAVMVIWRDSEMESLSHLVPLWIQDVEEDTLENAFKLGKEHDADVHSPSIIEIVKMTVDAKLEGYATESWVNDIIDVIELTPGDPGDPGDSAYEIWISAGNTGTEEDFLASLKGEKGDPGQNGESVVIDSQSMDNDGNVTIVFSDGNTIVIPAGTDGDDGTDGISPHIDQVTGNWFVGDTDTGVQAQGTKGDPGEPGSGGSGGGQEELVLWIESYDIGDGSTMTNITKASFNGETIPIPALESSFQFTGPGSWQPRLIVDGHPSIGFGSFRWQGSVLWKIEVVFSEGEFNVSQGDEIEYASSVTYTEAFGTLEGIFGDFSVVDQGAGQGQSLQQYVVTRFTSLPYGQGQAVIRVTPLIKY